MSYVRRCITKNPFDILMCATDGIMNDIALPSINARVVLPPCVVPGDSMEIPHANEQQQHLDENKKKHTCSISDSSSSKKSIAATVVFTPWENTKATNYFRHHCHTFLSISQEHRYKRKHEQVHCTYLIVSTSIDTSFSNLPSKLIKLQ